MTCDAARSSLAAAASAPATGLPRPYRGGSGEIPDAATGISLRAVSGVGSAVAEVGEHGQHAPVGVFGRRQ
jgi:hypothetical protein